MALVASGAIALSDVNVELGYSSTATIALNDEAVRTLFGIATGAIAMSDGYSKSNSQGYVENFFSTYTYIGDVRYSSSAGTVRSLKTDVPLANTAAWTCSTLTNGVYNYGGYSNMSVDASGNQYVTIAADGQTTLITSKLNSSNVVQWTRAVAAPSNVNWYPTQVATDSSGNVFVAVYKYNNGNNTSSGVLLKYNSSGTLQWQRDQTRGTGSTNVLVWYDMTVNSAGDVIVIGQSNQSGTTYGIVSKYNTSGTIQWSLRLTGSGGTPNCYGQKCAADSSGNTFVTFYNSTTYGDIGHLVKIDSSGTVTWQRKFTPAAATGGVTLSGVCVDSSGNVFVTGTATDAIGGGSVQNYGLIAKWNSSGTLQWSRFFNILAYNGNYNGALGSGNPVCDSSGNVYVCGGKQNPGSSYDWIVAKYTSTGEYSTANGGWQRQLSNYYTSDFANRCIINPATGKLIIWGATNLGSGYSSNACWVTMPTDGSATSGYANIWMESVSPEFVNRSLSLTEAAGSLTTASGSAENGYFTDSAASLTDSVGTSLSFTTATQDATTSTGGLVWIKQRTNDIKHQLIDTTQTVDNNTYALASSNTDAAVADSQQRFKHLAAGFSLGYDGDTSGTINAGNGNGNYKYVAWTFRRSKKFFDIVTYTGAGGTQNISHNLGSAPGCIIVKRTNTTGSWRVFHRSVSTQYGNLNSGSSGFSSTNAENVWGNNTTTVAPTSSVFTVGNDSSLNNSGSTYVAYLFAHNAGGFGATGTDNIISCGSYTGNGASGGQLINLGYEAQWVMIKRSSADGGWWTVDNMRGYWTNGGDYGGDNSIYANASNAEENQVIGQLDPRGFRPIQDNVNASGSTYIYMAIRRGPMEVPTVGTKVFANFYSSYSSNTQLTTSWPVDLSIYKAYSIEYDWCWDDRIRGTSADVNSGKASLRSNTPAAENNGYAYLGAANFDNMRGVSVSYAASTSYNGGNASYSLFRRAPGFFDTVCYKGTGSATTIYHNLGVTPELIIVKNRDSFRNWFVWVNGFTSAEYLELNESNVKQGSANIWNSTLPTSSVFSVDGVNNSSGNEFVAWLFATCPGVSKVGSYTGSGTTKQIECGFTAGARFVVIKRTDSTGNWYVWNSASGISAGNDPYIILNRTEAGVTDTDYIDTYSAGFEISSTAPAAINNSGGSYIFLAIA